MATLVRAARGLWIAAGMLLAACSSEVGAGDLGPADACSVAGCAIDSGALDAASGPDAIAGDVARAELDSGCEEGTVPSDAGCVPQWTRTSSLGAPEGRANLGMVWTGSEAIVWGGGDLDQRGTFRVATGGRYDPQRDTWTMTA